MMTYPTTLASQPVTRRTRGRWQSSPNVWACWALLAIMIGTAPVSAASPWLADDPANQDWHVSQEPHEAVFVGSGDRGAPRIVLQKSSLADKPLVLRITCDAPQCVIESGGSSVTFSVTPGAMVRVTLDGNAQRPRLKIDGRTPTPLQGQWIGLMLRNEDPRLSLQLVNATYATLRLGSSQAVTRVKAGTDQDHPRDMPEGITVIEQRPPPTPSPSKEVVTTQGIPHGAPLWAPSIKAGVDFTNAYFYRGLGQEDNDIVIQPWADVGINVIQENLWPWLDGVDLQVGVRSSHHFGPTGERPNGDREKFYELDFKGGVMARLFEKWAVGLYYLNRIGVNDRLGDVHQIEWLVTFDDRDPNFDFQFSPHALLVFEVEGKSDTGFDSGIYLELGIRPEFELLRVGPHRPLTLAIPATLGLSIADYYQDLSGEDDIFGYFQIGAELGFPLLIARGETAGRRWVVKALAGVDLLFLGNNTQNISEFRGTGGESVEVIGKVGINMEY